MWRYGIRDTLPAAACCPPRFRRDSDFHFAEIGADALCQQVDHDAVAQQVAARGCAVVATTMKPQLLAACGLSTGATAEWQMVSCGNPVNEVCLGPADGIVGRDACVSPDERHAGRCCADHQVPAGTSNATAVTSGPSHSSLLSARVSPAACTRPLTRSRSTPAPPTARACAPRLS